MVRLGLTVAFCFSLTLSAFSQLVVIPIPKVQAKKGIRLKSGRVQDTLAAMALPFWDDFSVSRSAYYPDSSRWQKGESVSLNTGMGANPPSIGMVSFDGLDSIGKPYDVVNSLDKGFGDYLVSAPILMGNVPQNQRDSVYLSFFYQWQGNGEPPDPGDQLEVDFKNNSSDSTNWVFVASVTSDGNQGLVITNATTPPDTVALSDSVFYAMILPIADSTFYHNQFQFRIRSYGRLSGPWDNWNVDYVYLNSHRFATDLSFPDRTIYSPLTSLFSDYWSIPAKHFFTDSSASPILISPSFAVTNLRRDQLVGNGQPVNYSSNVEISEWKNKSLTSEKSIKLDSAFAIIPDLEFNDRRIVTLNKIPRVQDFDAGSDSIRISLMTSINSGDNIIDKVPPRDSGDYLPKYLPIDFRVNDTTRSTYILANYYAYDDGTAEFGAGLNQPAAEVAYSFKMKTTIPDTIVALDLYFPDFGDESEQDIELRIRKDTSAVGLLYRETVPLQRSAQNKFWRHTLNTNTTSVRDSFLIGWMQTSAAVIAAGLDVSHDTGDRIYYNVNGYWEQNTEVKGSLMIRPVFGKGGLVTGLPVVPKILEAYPNPNAGTFYLTAKPDRLDIFDYTGRRMEFSQDGIDDRLKIVMFNASPGLYVLRAYVSGKLTTRKIMVTPQGQ